MGQQIRTTGVSHQSADRPLDVDAGQTRSWDRAHFGETPPPSVESLASDEEARRQWNENINRLRERAQAAGR